MAPRGERPGLGHHLNPKHFQYLVTMNLGIMQGVRRNRMGFAGFWMQVWGKSA
jgi:hypothetical protein